MGPGLTWNFLKSSQHSPKPILIFWSSITCVFGLYIHCQKLLVIKIWVFYPCQWWVSKKSLDGGWVGGVSSIQFYFGFLECFNFVKPLRLPLKRRWWWWIFSGKMISKQTCFLSKLTGWNLEWYDDTAWSISCKIDSYKKTSFTWCKPTPFAIYKRHAWSRPAHRQANVRGMHRR